VLLFGQRFEHAVRNQFLLLGIVRVQLVQFSATDELPKFRLNYVGINNRLLCPWAWPRWQCYLTSKTKNIF